MIKKLKPYNQLQRLLPVLCLGLVLILGFPISLAGQEIQASGCTAGDPGRREAIPGSCTTFAAQMDDTVLFGNNEDYSNPITYLWVVPSSEEGYGGVYFGYEQGEPQGGVNEMGVAWDGLALPPSPLDRIPGQTGVGRNFTRFMAKVLSESANVQEAIEFATQYYWGTTISHQILLADASGDAAVIGAGPQGELVVTRKSTGDGHLVATNFNLVNPGNTESDLPCWRYETASNMLEEIQRDGRLNVEAVRDILDAVHQESATNNTLYSNIFDLRNGKIYLYYWHQYDEVVTLDLQEMVADGEALIRIEELFSDDTTARADREFKRYTGEIMMTEEFIILGWLGLTMICLVLLVLQWRSEKDMPGALKAYWLITVLLLGLVGMLAYWFSYMRPKNERQPLLTGWQQALGASAISAAGYAASFLLILLFFFFFFPDSSSGPITLLVPLLVGLCGIRGPLITVITRSRYMDVLRRWVLAEIVSSILAIAAILFVNLQFIQILGSRYQFASDPGRPLFWGTVSLFGAVSLVAIVPLHMWLAYKGNSVWLKGFNSDGSFTEIEEPKFPPFRQVWIFILAGIGLLALVIMKS